MGAHNIKAKMQAKAYPEDHVADVTATFTSAAWDGSSYPTAAEASKIIVDIAALATAVNAINADLASWGITKSS